MAFADMFRKTKAEKAKDYIDTLEGARAFRKALLEGDEELAGVLGATEIEYSEPMCSTCGQHWTQGALQWRATFDDNGTLKGIIRQGR